MPVNIIENQNCPQYADVRAWGLYQDGKLVALGFEFAQVQSLMLQSYGDCREVTIVADKITKTTIVS